MELDTLRILVSLKCNLHCSYCCNEQWSIAKKFEGCTLNEIDFAPYKNVCISGGEPLLFVNRVFEVLWACRGKPVRFRPRRVPRSQGSLEPRYLGNPRRRIAEDLSGGAP